MKKVYLLIIIIFNVSFLISNELKIVTIGGSVTETVFSLGQGDKVIAVDLSSKIPEKVTLLPQVGYVRAISSEGILSMYPDIILTTSDIGPPKVISQIEDSGVTIEIFESPKDFNGILELVDEIGKYLDVTEKAQLLNKKILNEKEKLDLSKNSFSEKPKIIFFYNPSENSFLAAGSDTRGSYLIEFLGGINVFKDEFSKYKKITKEDIVSYNPDVILVGSSRGQNIDQLLSIFTDKIEFETVTAVKEDKVIFADVSKYLTFGPSFIENTSSLVKKINSIEND